MLVANQFDNELLSMSPMDDTWFRHKPFDQKIHIYYGYRTSYEVTGWSILVHKSVIEKIGGFDEQFTFWYQDNDYSNCLIENKIKHGLITNSKVTHLLSRSHGLIEEGKKYEMTDGLGIKFNDKWIKK
jgi:GT2 family glycosyltransferase